VGNFEIGSNQVYLDSARLLTRVAPPVLVDDTFALKGGTAINLFVRDMPRLSVDLDLVFPDHTVSRAEALKRINEAIRQSVARLKKQGFQTHAPASADAGETKLLVRQGTIEVKVEVNFVMRGTVNPVRMASLTQSARDTLQADLEVPVVSLEDVYGGKLVAAMDRQHPRDLFDVMQLFAHEGNPRLFGRDAFNDDGAIIGTFEPMFACRLVGRAVIPSSRLPKGWKFQHHHVLEVRGP
jgi:predicted nucleotidyltransferase component of viral defense system